MADGDLKDITKHENYLKFRQQPAIYFSDMVLETENDVKDTAVMLIDKNLATRNLRWDDTVVPTMAELERFKAGLGADAEAELLAAITPDQLAHKEVFAPGDVVKVRDGDLKHIVGVVQSVTAATGSIIVMPTNTEGLLKGKQFKDG